MHFLYNVLNGISSLAIIRCIDTSMSPWTDCVIWGWVLYRHSQRGRKLADFLAVCVCVYYVSSFRPLMYSRRKAKTMLIYYGDGDREKGGGGGGGGEKSQLTEMTDLLFMFKDSKKKEVFNLQFSVFQSTRRAACQLYQHASSRALKQYNTRKTFDNSTDAASTRFLYQNVCQSAFWEWRLGWAV